jgi:hypothetical protein
VQYFGLRRSVDDHGAEAVPGVQRRQGPRNLTSVF